MRRLKTACFALPVFALPAVAPGQEMWAKVPAMPTSCYDNTRPGFSEILQNIRHEVVVASDKQEEINAAIRQKSIDMDPSEKQQKMMAFMMKNPSEAGAFMQKIAAAGETQPGAQEKQNQAEIALDARLKAIDQQFAADIGMLDPIWKKIIENRPDVGFAGNVPAANRYIAQYNAEYERVCAKWLAATSPYLMYLADLKKHLVDVRMASFAEREKFVKTEFELYGIPHKEYKPTAEHEAVTKYLDAMHAATKWRRAAPVEPVK